MEFPFPRQEFVDAIDRMIGDAGENVGEPGLRVDAVELGGLDERIHHSGTVRPALRPGEQPRFPAEREAAQRPLGRVVRQADATILEESGEGRLESAPIKAVFGFDSIVGAYASPYAPGTAYVLLHHSFGEVNGKKGVWGARDRRHGRDHPGYGESRRRPRRRHQAFDAGPPGPRGEWARRRG
jgi:hypothetical protein